MCVCVCVLLTLFYTCHYKVVPGIYKIRGEIKELIDPQYTDEIIHTDYEVGAVIRNSQRRLRLNVFEERDFLPLPLPLPRRLLR